LTENDPRAEPDAATHEGIGRTGKELDSSAADDRAWQPLPMVPVWRSRRRKRPAEPEDVG